jgi:hypothetical protein
MDSDQHQHTGGDAIHPFRPGTSGTRALLSRFGYAMKLSVITIFVCLLLPLTRLAAQQVVDSSASNSDSPAAPISVSTNQTFTYAEVQAARAQCIESRRIICGRILKVLPGGLVVDSGYTSLMRPELEKSWLIPSTVVTSKEPNLVEKDVPDSPCAGMVYLTDLPKSRRVTPKPYDYVVLEGFTDGEYTYTSVGTIQHTVRQFTCSLPTSVRYRLASHEMTRP